MVLNYIGSKNKLLPFINEAVQSLCATDKPTTFCDAFSGTGTVGNYFKNEFSVTSNDTEYYSYVINNGYMCCKYSIKIQKIIDNLNELKGVQGLVADNYSPLGDRMYFTTENAKKIDAVRTEINNLLNNKRITKKEYLFLLASLLEAADKVANIACIYGSYLKNFKKSAVKPIVINPIHKETKIKNKNKTFNLDVSDLFKKDIKYNIVYLDPPYNQRQYSSNYFVLNYIAKYKNVELKGKTGIILDCFKSKFSSKILAKEEFKKLINSIKSNYILLSYNNEGIINSEDILEILKLKGDVEIKTKQYKKFKAQQTVKIEFVTEYLYVVKCTSWLL